VTVMITAVVAIDPFLTGVFGLGCAGIGAGLHALTGHLKRRRPSTDRSRPIPVASPPTLTPDLEPEFDSLIDRVASEYATARGHPGSSDVAARLLRRIALKASVTVEDATDPHTNQGRFQ